MASRTIREENGIRYEHRGAEDTKLVYCVCCDCGGWAYDGQAIKHSKRCDTPTAQPTRFDEPKTPSERKAQRDAREIKRLAERGEIAKAGLTEDEIVAAVDLHVISVSDAMNRDY
jgi:hypothetical protein